jgi:hypothetical protein
MAIFNERDGPKAVVFSSNSQLAWSNGSGQGLASIGVMKGSEGIAAHLTGRRKADEMSKNPLGD